MKTTRLNYLLLLLIIPAVVLAGGTKGKYTKEKKISKAYMVNSNAGLDVTNMYGSIYVTTWDEDKTTVDVVIKVSGNNEDKVDKRLATIDVDFEAARALVKANTRIGSMNSNNLSMEINYTIKIPKNGSINLNNQYGSIITGKIFGKADIKCQYGDINIDELNNALNNINLSYSGTTKINYMNAGDVKAEYSSFKLAKGNILKIKAAYTGMVIGEVQDINFKTDYGDLNIKNAGNAAGSGDYSALRFGGISGLLNATCNYGEVKVGSIGKNVKNVAVNATYTTVHLNYAGDYAFDFELKLEYGSLRGATDFKFTSKKEEDNEYHYKGYHKQQGTNRIYVSVEYGDIKFNKG